MILVCSITVKGRGKFIDVTFGELSKVYSSWLEGTQQVNLRMIFLKISSNSIVGAGGEILSGCNEKRLFFDSVYAEVFLIKGNDIMF